MSSNTNTKRSPANRPPEATNGSQTERSKRTKIFKQMADENTKVSGLINQICDPSDMNESELKECYKIADSAVKAQFENYKATTAVAEEFVCKVFDDWTSEKSAGAVAAVKGPAGDGICITSDPVGKEISSRREVSWEFRLSLSPAQFTFVTKIDKSDSTPVDVKDVDWYASPDDFAESAMRRVIARYQAYNADRAVQYARRMLHYRSWGQNYFGIYEFASVDELMRNFPILGSLRDKEMKAPVLFGKEKSVLMEQ